MLKSQQNEKNVEDNTHTNVCESITHHEIIYRMLMCVLNENCGFMRSYRKCYIASGEKVSLTKNNSKTQLNKKNIYFFKMFFIRTLQPTPYLKLMEQS